MSFILATAKPEEVRLVLAELKAACNILDLVIIHRDIRGPVTCKGLDALLSIKKRLITRLWDCQEWLEENRKKAIHA